jgi:tetratricopeptide (TPR) repeat protein
MKHYKILILSIAMVLSSCGTKGQQPDNTKPMYGEVPKGDEYKKIDEDFKKECLTQFKTIDSSVYVQIDRAWRYFYHNDLKTAMKRFNQAWLLNSEFPDSYFGFAALMEMQGNKIESERFYKIGFEKDKTKERAKNCYQRIADCKEQLQDFKGTIEAYTKLAELKPNDAFAFKKIGYFQMQTGNSKDALTAFGKAIELDPTDAMTYNNRAYLYQTEKNYKNAIADYTKAIKLDSKYISAYVNRGITQMGANNFEAAKKDFEICVQLDSNSGELRRILGLSKLNLKDKSAACNDFELAKKLGDTQADELIKQNCK